MFAKQYTDYKVVEFMAQVADSVGAGAKYVFEKVTTDPIWGGGLLGIIALIVVFEVLRRKSAG
jgi:hypothetical protein